DVPARGFTAMMVLLDAINRAGSTDPEAIREALEATDLGPDDTIMPWQGVRFDEKHQNTLGGGIIVQIQNGEYRTVYPFDVATVEPSYPLQPWDQRGAEQLRGTPGRGLPPRPIRRFAAAEGLEWIRRFSC